MLLYFYYLSNLSTIESIQFFKNCIKCIFSFNIIISSSFSTNNIILVTFNINISNFPSSFINFLYLFIFYSHLHSIFYLILFEIFHSPSYILTLPFHNYFHFFHYNSTINIFPNISFIQFHFYLHYYIYSNIDTFLYTSLFHFITLIFITLLISNILYILILPS